jgi:protein gp37
VTRIEWCDLTINPVSGCLRGCSFCYARRMAKRLAGMERKHPGSTGYPTEGDPFQPTFHTNKIDKILKLKGRGKRIFLDSMGDLFSEGMHPAWILETIDAVRQKPEHIFIVLTKWTERLAHYHEIGVLNDLPQNLWIGTSLTCQDEAHRVTELRDALPNTHKLVSCEPLLGPITIDIAGIEWIIIGAETGNYRRGRIEPQVEWIEALRKGAERTSTPVFFKDNLRQHCLPGRHPQQYPSFSAEPRAGIAHDEWVG